MQMITIPHMPAIKLGGKIEWGVKMKIVEMAVRKTNSYEKPASQLVAKVKVEDDEGNVMEIVLSAGATGRIFDSIAAEIGLTAKKVADRVSDAARNAADEMLLIDKYGPKSISANTDDFPI